MASISSEPPPVKPGGPFAVQDDADKACNLFRRLAYGRAVNHFGGCKEALRELHDLGWMIVPIAPKRGRGRR